MPPRPALALFALVSLAGVAPATAQTFVFHLSGGQEADIRYAEPLIEGQHFDVGIGDKGYDSDRLVQYIESRGAAAVIPPKTNRKEPRAYDEHL